MLWRLELISDHSLDSIHKALKVEEVWLKGFQTTDGGILLAYFVFVWGMQMWEFTSEHADVRRKVADARIGYVSACRKAQAIIDADAPTKPHNSRAWRIFSTVTRISFI